MKFMYLFTLLLMISCSTAKTFTDCVDALAQASQSESADFNYYCQVYEDYYRCSVQAEDGDGIHLEIKENVRVILRAFGCTTDLDQIDKELGVDGGTEAPLVLPTGEAPRAWWVNDSSSGPSSVDSSGAKTVLDCNNAYYQAAESKNYNLCRSTVDYYRCLIEANDVYLGSKDYLNQALKVVGCTTDLGYIDEELGVDGGNGEDKNGSGGGRGRDSNNSSSTLPTIGWLFIALVTCFLTTMRNIN